MSILGSSVTNPQNVEFGKATLHVLLAKEVPRRSHLHQSLEVKSTGKVRLSGADKKSPARQLALAVQPAILFLRLLVAFRWSQCRGFHLAKLVPLGDCWVRPHVPRVLWWYHFGCVIFCWTPPPKKKRKTRMVMFLLVSRETTTQRYPPKKTNVLFIHLPNILGGGLLHPHKAPGYTASAQGCAS